MSLDELREFNRKLGLLLDDPQPGCSTWCVMLGKLINEFITAWKA